MLGYKPKVTGVATTTVDFYQKVPATGEKPDYDYALSIAANTALSSNASNFLLQESVDFSITSPSDPTDVKILTVSETGNPLYFLLKKDLYLMLSWAWLEEQLELLLLNIKQEGIIKSSKKKNK